MFDTRAIRRLGMVEFEPRFYELTWGVCRQSRIGHTPGDECKDFDHTFRMSARVSTTLPQISLEMLEGDRESGILRG